jgi:hypothetical protein
MGDYGKIANKAHGTLRTLLKSPRERGGDWSSRGSFGKARENIGLRGYPEAKELRDGIARIAQKGKKSAKKAKKAP